MPRKTLKERNQPNDAKNNRIRPILDDLIGIEDPDDLMLEIIDNLQESGKVPSVGKAYVFIYNAKTPNLEYDQNPLVAVSNVFTWGFRGFNFHWGETRQYTWNEVVGQLYEVDAGEISDLREIPFANFR